jgi:DNA modification methylase
VALGVHGRDRTNVWTYPGANRRGSSAAQALADHPTPKPVELVVDAILDVTHAGDVVLDPFAGSGTTIIASERCDREARGIELDPKYVDRAVRRWERLTGDRAVHIDTGLTFAELVEQRTADEGEGDHG